MHQASQPDFTINPFINQSSMPEFSSDHILRHFCESSQTLCIRVCFLKSLTEILCMQSTFFVTVGTPSVDAASSFLLGNPVTSSFFQSLADDPNTQQILGTVKAVADVIVPLETAALVRQH